MNNRMRNKAILLVAAMMIITAASTYMRADTGTCGGSSITLPFVDVSSGNVFFCSIAEAYFSALTNGTDATHYSPAANVTREQMAAFVTRTMDQSLTRGSNRAPLDQFWTTTPRYDSASGGLGTTTVGDFPLFVKSDGEDLWVADAGSNSVSQVHASNGKLLSTWTGASSARGVLVAMGRVFVTGLTNPGKLYMVDPTPVGGAVTQVSGAMGNDPDGIAFDGSRIWTTNSGGSVSIVTPGMTTPWAVTQVSAGFTQLSGILFDGYNIWVTDRGVNALLKLNQNGAVVQTVNVGNIPQYPAFDGTNIWVPNYGSDSVSVVRAATGAVVATLIGNGLGNPIQAAFDGQRILVTNSLGDSVSLWNATDLTPIGSFSTGVGTGPYGACSDGTYFWITLMNTDQLARF